MPAILSAVLKWLATAIILPLIEKWIAGITIANKKIATYKEKKAEAIKKGNEVETNPNADPDILP